MHEVTAADLRDIYLAVDATTAANQRAWQHCLEVLRAAEVKQRQLVNEGGLLTSRDVRPIPSERWHRRHLTDTTRW